MRIFIPCTQLRKWYQIRRHRWTSMDQVVISPYGSMSARYTCGRCGCRKTVFTPG